MAKVNLNEVVKSGQAPLPRDRYKAECVKAEFKMSKAGNPMIELKNELRCAEPIDIDGKKYDPNGMKFNLYLPLSEDRLDQTQEFHIKMGLPMEIDDENPDVEVYRGLWFNILLEAEEMFARRRPEPGQAIGEEILDDNGKKISMGYRLNAGLFNVLDPAEPDSNTPY